MMRKNRVEEILSAGLNTPASIKGKSRSIAKVLPNKKRSYTFFRLIYQILRHDSIVRRIIDKYVEEVLRNGYALIGRNDLSVSYLQKRLMQMEKYWGINFYDVICDAIFELVAYGNVFIYKVRDNAFSGGRGYTTPDGKYIKPIAYFEVLHTPSVEAIDYEYQFYKIKNTLEIQDERIPRQASPNEIFSGYIKKPVKYIYKEPSTETYLYIPAENISHAKLDAIYTSNEVGLPFIEPVIIDVKTLRRMEENAELLVFQYAIPLYHFYIDRSKHASAPGTEAKAIESYAEEIYNMIAEGAIVSDDIYKVEVVGANREAIDIIPHLNYYKKRIAGGLGMSPLDIGDIESANRSTAEFLNSARHGTLKRIATIISNLFTSIFDEILHEGRWINYYAQPEENRVKLHIDEPDFAAKQEKSILGVTLYQANLITEDEARVEYLGKSPLLPDDRKKLYFLNVQLITNLIRAVDEPFLQFLSVDPNVLRQIVPINQYGMKLAKSAPSTNTVKGKQLKGTKTNDTIEDKLSPEDMAFNYKPHDKRTLELFDLKHLYLLITDFWNEYSGAILHKISKVETLSDKNRLELKFAVTPYTERFYRIFESYLKNLYHTVYRSYAHHSPSSNKYKIAIDTFKNHFKNLQTHLFTHLGTVYNRGSKIKKKSERLAYTEAFLDSLGKRFAKEIKYAITWLYNIAVYDAAKASGVTELETDNVSPSDSDKEYKKGPFIVSKIDIYDLPPWHPNCSTLMKFKKED